MFHGVNSHAQSLLDNKNSSGRTKSVQKTFQRGHTPNLKPSPMRHELIHARGSIPEISVDCEVKINQNIVFD